MAPSHLRLENRRHGGCGVCKVGGSVRGTTPLASPPVTHCSEYNTRWVALLVCGTLTSLPPRCVGGQWKGGAGGWGNQGSVGQRVVVCSGVVYFHQPLPTVSSIM